MEPADPARTAQVPEREPEGVPRAFRVPAGEALDGRLVRARDALPGVAYRCPGCGTPLLLRRGSVRCPHFAHRSHGFCSPETALHRGIKHLIARMLERCRPGRRRGIPRMRVPCAGSLREDARSRWECPGEAWVSLADLPFDAVALEAPTPDGLRPDILLLREGQPVLAIEVRVTHAVDEAKAARAAFPWVEVEARGILAAPYAWRPTQFHHPWRSSCFACAAAGLLGPQDLGECTDPGDRVAQLGAVAFQARVQEWLRAGSRGPKPSFRWKCPGCGKGNARPLRRERILGADLATALGPPILPQVVLHLAEGEPLLVAFDFPVNPLRPRAVAPLAGSGPPVLRVTPGLKHPHLPALNGTNRPLAFRCTRCGGDALGAFPSPLQPLSLWERESDGIQ